VGPPVNQTQFLPGKKDRMLGRGEGEFGNFYPLHMQSGEDGGRYCCPDQAAGRARFSRIGVMWAKAGRVDDAESRSVGKEESKMMEGG